MHRLHGLRYWAQLLSDIFVPGQGVAAGVNGYQPEIQFDILKGIAKHDGLDQAVRAACIIEIQYAVPCLPFLLY